MTDDYEDIRRNKAEERRRKRDEERKKRRAKFSKLTSTVVASKEDTKTTSARTRTTAGSEIKSSNCTSKLSYKRSRADAERLEKLKEEKRAEDGLRSIQEMFGSKYVNSFNLESRKETPPKRKARSNESKRLALSHSEIFYDGLDRNAKESPLSSSTGRKMDSIGTSQHHKSVRGSFGKGKLEDTEHHQQTNPLIYDRIKPARTQKDDSDSDEDLIALAQKLQQKRKLSPQQRMAASYNSTSAAKKGKVLPHASKTKASINFNDDSSGDDLMEYVNKLETKKIASAKNSLNQSQEDIFSTPSLPVENKKSNENVEVDSGSDGEDLLAYSRRLHKIQKRKRKELENDDLGDSDRFSLSDPESVEELEDKDNRNAAIEKELDRNTPKKLTSRKQKTPSVHEADLWEDSDNESSKEKSSNANADKNGMKAKDSTRSGRKGGATYQKAFVDPESDLSEDDFDDDAQLEKQLKPTFENPKWISECEPFVLTRVDGSKDQVPASISRYIKDYQKEGVQFLHKLVTNDLGAVLGDDMGLGKTVQLISLLAALQEKSGTKKDLKIIKERYNRIERELKKQREDEDLALLRGGTVKKPSPHFQPRPYAPVLVIVPPSVITNWENEFKQWGYFAVASYRDRNKTEALNRIIIGKDDILLCGKSVLSHKTHFHPLLDVRWKLIVVDEFHEYKNGNTTTYKGLAKLRNKSVCPLIGMTGTLMSNSHKELHTLIDLVQPSLLGDWKAFQSDYSRPIMLSRAKDAKEDVLDLGKSRYEELNDILRNVTLRRDKTIVLEDDLPTKNQKVLFCPPSDLQKALYKHIIELPEYHLLRTANSPCDCGVNQGFFTNYKNLPTKGQQLNYYRRHKNEIVQRKKCCYQIPVGKTALWPAQHPDGEPCDRCPFCILLPALNKLYKICSHASLLQVDAHPDTIEGETAKEKAEKELAFAKIAIPKDILMQLPGQSYIRETSILDDHGALSGKMKTLDYCLKRFERRRDRVLLFSYSTVTLDLIQQFVKERGYSHLRLDGSTPVKTRQGLIDQYQQNDDIFLFLISTKAGGMGLNLTAANRVIIYDVNWNPSHDEQAQDRSFRIGQERDVEVIRLVTSGMIEELMYMRQVYKVQLKQQTLQSSSYSEVQPARIFRGVAEDKNRKGELFGVENLLKFKDGSFMEGTWKATGVKPKKSSDGMYTTSALADGMAGMSYKEVCGEKEDEGFLLTDDKGVADDETKDSDSDENMREFNHEDFLREDRGDAVLMPGDKGYDEEMGGSSQIVDIMVMENDVDTVKMVDNDSALNKADTSVKFAATGKSVGTVEDALFASIEKTFEKAVSETSSVSSKKASAIVYAAARNLPTVQEEESDEFSSGQQNLSIRPAEKVAKKAVNVMVEDSGDKRVTSSVGKSDAKTVKKKSTQGTKKSKPTFSSRRMLFIPSYLKDKK